jgi:hypothetical protein
MHFMIQGMDLQVYKIQTVRERNKQKAYYFDFGNVLSQTISSNSPQIHKKKFKFRSSGL